MKHQVLRIAFLATPFVCSQILQSTVQNGELSVCSFLKSFDANCLVPVLGTYGTLEVKTNMEGACEVMFWGVRSKDLLEPLNCTSNAHAIMNIAEDSLADCRTFLGTQSYVTIADFKRQCVHHASTDHFLLSTDETASSAAKHVETRGPIKKVVAASSMPRITLQSDANVNSLQPNARDMVHTVWLNGPTYSKKIQTNRLADGKWPTFANDDAATGLYSLFLRAGNGHCISTSTGYDLSLGQCWSWSGGVSLGFNENGALADENGHFICAEGNPAVPAAGDLLIISSSCASSIFEQDSDGCITHTATGLYLSPDITGASYSDSFTATSSTTLTLSATMYKWGFWKAWNELPGYNENGLLLGGSVSVKTQVTPPRYQVQLGAADGSTSCESFRTRGYGKSGSTVENNITLLNLDTGEYYPHSIHYIEHWGWPAACTLMFRHHSSTDDSGVYPDYSDDFNAFFGSGTRIRFEESKTNSGACDPERARYTGYDTTGSYCYTSSGSLDESPHLILYSGWVGLVVDASAKNDNVIPKFGAVPDEVANGTSAEVYAALPESELNVTLTTLSGTTYRLGKQSSDFAVISAVRQGIVVTHILVTDLVWTNQGVGIADVDIDPPQWWLEVEVRGTSMSVQVGWEELDVNNGCLVCESATVQISMAMGNEVLANSVDFVPGVQFDTLSLVFEAGGKSFNTLDASLVVESDSCVVNYRTEKNDILLEVPTSMYRCGYNVACSPLVKLDFTVSNPNPEEAVVPLSFSRNFPSRIDGLVQSTIGAEITGLTAVLRDLNGDPTGIPMQISKKWDEVSSRQIYEAGYDYGAASSTHPQWWTMNYLLRIPANSSFSGVVAVIYNEYGNVASFSAAQLSLIGYTDTWTWLEQALGSLGENICFDILGIHARASTTDVRVHLFDGDWNENIGGADWLVYFNVNGSYVYPKAADVDIKASGPCLSNTTFSQSYEDSILMKAAHCGARTNDWAKNFYDVRYDIATRTNFSRLSFFQFNADFYAHDNHAQFHYGSATDAYTGTYESLDLDCEDDNTYPTDMPFRKVIPGKGPWWAHFGIRTNTKVASEVGDVGFIIRSYDAVLGGVPQSAPAVSVLCNKIEISVPEAIGNQLLPGDYVKMQVEVHILPQIGADFDEAFANVASTLSQPSSSLSLFVDAQNSTEMVLATARGDLHVTPIFGRVESHYPIRVCTEPAQQVDQLWFHVNGSTTGYVPIVLCGVSTHTVGDGLGLWVQYADEVEYSLVDQSYHDDSDFWQTNYDATSGTYELVFNLEILESESTYLAWGFEPNVPSFQPTAFPSIQPTALPTILPTFAPTSDPSLPPSPLPTISPTHMPTPVPTEPPTRPSALPTPVPSDSPSPLPSLSPSSLPTMAPTSDRTVTVAVAFVLGASSAPSTTDVSTLKTTVSLLVGVSEARVKHFQVLSQASEASRRLREGKMTQSDAAYSLADSTTTDSAASMPYRILSTSYEWSTSFEVANEWDDSITTSTINWETNISSSLATVDVAASDALHLNITMASNVSVVAKTRNPSELPTPAPTPEPTVSLLPTSTPSADPTSLPSSLPTSPPTPPPSEQPSAPPTLLPTPPPSIPPTGQPSPLPTSQPTPAPSGTPQPTMTDCAAGYAFCNGGVGPGCCACAAGTYAATAGQNFACTPCAGGRYQGDLGQSSCDTCSAGRYCSGVSTFPFPCGSGTYSAAEASACTTCEAGRYNPVNKQSSCELLCPQGTYSSSGAASCTDCPVGRYANNIGTADECVACSVNAYQGLAGRSSCESCALGQFQPLIGQSACLETPPPTPVPTQPPTYDGSLRLDVSLKLNATADLNRNSSSGATLSDVLREVLTLKIASPLSLDATPKGNRTNVVSLGAQNASLVDFSASLLSPSPSTAAANKSSSNRSLSYQYAVSFALLMDPTTLAAVAEALAAAAYNKTEAPTPNPTLSGLYRRQLRAPSFSSSSSRSESSQRRRVSSSSGSSSDSASSSIGSTIGSTSDVGGGLPAWRFARLDAVDALRYTIIDELSSETLANALNTALANDGVVVTIGSNSIMVQQVTRAPTAVPTPLPTLSPTSMPTGHPTSVPVLAPTPLPTPVRSFPPTTAPMVPESDGFPFGALSASLGGAILLFLGLSGLGFWVARNRGYCGGKGGDIEKHEAGDESGMGEGAVTGNEAQNHDLAKKRQARRASLSTAQGIANDELQLIDPHRPFRNGHRGGESKGARSSVTKAPKPRIWHAKFRGVPAIAKEACPGYEPPSRYELRSIAKKVELLQSVEHQNVLGVLGLVTAHVPLLPPAVDKNDGNEAKEASAVREPGDLLSHDEHSPKKRNSLAAAAAAASDKSSAKDQERGEQVSVVVLEHFEHGYALDSSAYESDSFTVETFSAAGLGIVSGLAGMHAALVEHGNLCPANVLVDLSGEGEVLKLQLSSFALSNKRGALVDQPAFVAPEMSSASEDRKVKVDPLAADMYAFGFLLWELWFRATPFSHQSSAMIKAHVGNGRRLPMAKGVTPSCLAPPPKELKELITSCWHQDPSARPSAATAKKRFLEMIPALTEAARNPQSARPSVVPDTSSSTQGGTDDDHVESKGPRGEEGDEVSSADSSEIAAVVDASHAGANSSPVEASQRKESAKSARKATSAQKLAVRKAAAAAAKTTLEAASGIDANAKGGSSAVRTEDAENGTAGAHSAVTASSEGGSRLRGRVAAAQQERSSGNKDHRKSPTRNSRSPRKSNGASPPKPRQRAPLPGRGSGVAVGGKGSGRGRGGGQRELAGGQALPESKSLSSTTGLSVQL